MISVYPERLCGQPEMVPDFVELEVWRDEIEAQGRIAGIPIEAVLDQMKVGKGLSGIGAKAQDCVVIYNTQHRKSYYCYVLVVNKTGNLYHVSKYLGGDSINFRNSLSGNGLIGGFIQNRAKVALNEEHMYYDALDAVVSAALMCSIGRRPQRRVPPAPVPPPVRPAAQTRPSGQTRQQPSGQRSTSPRPAQTPPAQEPERVFFKCPKCGKNYRVKKKNIRIAFTCTQCGKQFSVDCSNGKV